MGRTANGMGLQRGNAIEIAGSLHRCFRNMLKKELKTEYLRIFTDYTLPPSVGSLVLIRI
jgi:hypothetical protein